MAGGRNTLVRDALVGAMVLGAVLLLGYMATRLGSVTARDGRSVVMVFDDATGLIETAPISISGVKVGSVRVIEYGDGGAKVTATIRRDIPLYKDARAGVKAKSLLGEKFVALDPGTEAAGPLEGDRVATLPSADIDRMAGAIARLAEHVDPDDVRRIVHGLAVALGEDGKGSSVPEAIVEVGRDLHRLAASIEKATGSADDVAQQLKPVLEKLDALATRTDKTLAGLQPTVDRLPATMTSFERVAKRLDALLARAEKTDVERLKYDIKKILQEEGVYVRMKSRNVKAPPGSKATPKPTEEEDDLSENPFDPTKEPTPR